MPGRFTSRGNNITLMTGSNQDIQFNSDGGTVSANAPFSWRDGSWHLIDVTYAAGVASVYADGQLLIAAPITLNTTADSGLVVGNSRLAASYDEAAVYPTALSAARISAHWARGQ
ncbi:MAG: LamG-like jellyroll fold domain-containing protein, partial [Nakamurella sp.]